MRVTEMSTKYLYGDEEEHDASGANEEEEVSEGAQLQVELDGDAPHLCQQMLILKVGRNYPQLEPCPGFMLNHVAERTSQGNIMKMEEEEKIRVTCCPAVKSILSQYCAEHRVHIFL